MAWLAIFTAALCVASGASAQGDASGAEDEMAVPAGDEAVEGGDDARTLFQRGQAAYAQGDYEGAIRAWTRAYELDPRPLLQFNLSQAFERLGRLQEAVDALGVYLENADPSDAHQADARARQASLRERIARTSVIVSGGPEGATIVVDGDDRGRTPRPDPIQVSPGSHRIVVSAEGYEDFTSSVVVPAGQSLTVAVEMRAVAGGGGGETVRAEPGGPDLLVPAILFGAGGAVIAAGIVMGAVALGQAEGAPARESSEADSARGLALGADVMIGIGAACAVAGLVVLIVEVTSSGAGAASEDDASASLEVTPFAGAGVSGIAIEGSF